MPPKKRFAPFKFMKSWSLANRLALIGILVAILFGILTLITPIIPLLWKLISPKPTSEPFPEKEGSFNVLLLPFQPLEDCTFKETFLEETLRRRLLALSEEKQLNLQVKLDTLQTCPATFDEGKAIGKNLNADLVIWGDFYEQCESDTSQACLKYALVKDIYINIAAAGQTGIQPLRSMTQLTEGYLQEDIDYIIYWTIGNRYYGIGNYREAAAAFQTAYQLRGEDIDILTKLSFALMEAGELSEAENYFRRSLQLREERYDPDHHAVASGLNQLAILLQDQGRYAEAESLYRRALEIGERTLGRDDLAVASWLNNLATLLSDQGNYAEAEPLFRRALKIDEKALGKDHPDVAADLNNLALLLSDQGNYAEAKPLFRRALEIFEKALGKDHPNTKKCRENLESLLAEKK